MIVAPPLVVIHPPREDLSEKPRRLVTKDDEGIVYSDGNVRATYLPRKTLSDFKRIRTDHCEVLAACRFIKSLGSSYDAYTEELRTEESRKDPVFVMRVKKDGNLIPFCKIVGVKYERKYSSY